MDMVKSNEEKLSCQDASCHDKASCAAVMLPVRDALDVLNGKWKLPIIISLLHGARRFREIANEIPNISDRMLSKELQDLELNLLITRKVHEGRPVIIEYTMTDYGHTLKPVLDALRDWGQNHRKAVFQK